ncbi:MAG: CopG family transcriptional regulator [Verrucomicrobia bacterium]|nr:CopG family transcriptional regulator [Verrucomicrobiota bacterium]
MAKRSKEQVLTFKADVSLLEAMKGVRNRSEFIRSAIQAALESTCPLCMGTGILSPNQKKHWDAFAEDHSVCECSDCNETILVCANAPAVRKHVSRVGKRNGAKNGEPTR